MKPGRRKDGRRRTKNEKGRRECPTDKDSSKANTHRWVEALRSLARRLVELRICTTGMSIVMYRITCQSSED